MKLLQLTFLLLTIISCKQERKTDLPKLKTDDPKSETLSQDTDTMVKMDSIYDIYKTGKVDNFDWDIVFNKAEAYRKVSEPYSDKTSIPNDFLEFSKQFMSDAEFQKSHIDFKNLIAVIGACEDTYVLSESNWVFDDWNFIQDIGIDADWENTFHYSDTVFFLEYVLKEVGTITMLGFEKINGQWYLTLADYNDC